MTFKAKLPRERRLGLRIGAVVKKIRMKAKAHKPKRRDPREEEETS